MSEKRWPLWKRRVNEPAPKYYGPYVPEPPGLAPDGWQGPWPPPRSTATQAVGDDGSFPEMPDEMRKQWDEAEPETDVVVSWPLDGSVSYEDFPENLKHLHPDAPHLVCSRCHRHSWALDDESAECGMPQPDGSWCYGRFELP